VCSSDLLALGWLPYNASFAFMAAESGQKAKKEKVLFFISPCDKL